MSLFFAFSSSLSLCRSLTLRTGSRCSSHLCLTLLSCSLSLLSVLLKLSLALLGQFLSLFDHQLLIAHAAKLGNDFPSLISARWELNDSLCQVSDVFLRPVAVLDRANFLLFLLFLLCLLGRFLCLLLIDACNQVFKRTNFPSLV